MAKLTNLSTGIAPAFDTKVARVLPKTADPFYLSPQWRALITQIIAERGRRCQDCGRTNCRIFGDHIKELKDGGAPLDGANIWLRCGRCHTIKTNEARAQRMAVRT